MECKFRALGLGKTHHMEESSGRVFDSGYEEAGAGRQAHRGNMAACGLLVTGKPLCTILKSIYQSIIVTVKY